MMTVKEWIRATEEVVVNMDEIEEEMDLDEWMDLLYESLLDYDE